MLTQVNEIDFYGRNEADELLNTNNERIDENELETAAYNTERYTYSF